MALGITTCIGCRGQATHSSSASQDWPVAPVGSQPHPPRAHAHPVCRGTGRGARCAGTGRAAPSPSQVDATFAMPAAQLFSHHALLFRFRNWQPRASLPLRRRHTASAGHRVRKPPARGDVDSVHALAIWFGLGAGRAKPGARGFAAPPSNAVSERQSGAERRRAI